MDIVTFTIHSFDCSHIIHADVLTQNLLISRNAFIAKPMKRLVVFITAAILLSIVVFQPVSSAPPGMLYENPLTVSSQVVGSIFTIQIIVGGMDQFNTWDIQVVTDTSALNATGLSITGNMFESLGGSAFEPIHCVNGKGTGCTTSDGPGIVRSAYGNTAFASGDGLLFTITYQVVSGSPYSAFTIRNDQFGSSSPAGVPHFTEYGYYGVHFGSGCGKRPVPT